MLFIIKRVKNDFLKDSSFFTSFFSLVLLQGLNYLIAFFITPYVVRKLGPENFGLVSFSQSYIIYFTLLINFGFDLSATRDIANNAQNQKEINKIFSEVLVSKVFLFVVSVLIFSITLMFSAELKLYSLLNIISFLINIGYVLYPQWLFQGLSKMKTAVIITTVSRLAMLFFIFLLVRGKEDYMMYNLLNSVFNVCIGVIALIYLLHKKIVKVCTINVKNVISKLKSSFTVFLSLAVYSLYTSSNIVFLGFLSTKTATGYFSSAAKFITICVTVLFIPFATVVFPRVANKFNESFTGGAEFLKKITWITLVMGITMSLVTFFFSDLLIHIFYGKEFSPAAKILRYLSALPLITALSNVFAVQGLLNLKMDKHFLVTMLVVGFFSIVLNILLIPTFDEVGTCISWNIAEIIYLIISCALLTRRIGFPFDINVLKSTFKFK